MKIRSLYSILAITLLGFACSAPPKSTTVETTATATPQAAAPPEAASGQANLSSPESLVSDLYKAHDAGRGPFFQKKDRALVDKYFTKPLADLIWKEANTESDDVLTLDGDPLYNAQDLEIKDLSIGKGDVKGDAATVAVTFLNFGQKQSITHKLKLVGDAWKIDDIMYSPADSLLKWLRETYETKPAANGRFEGKYIVGPTSCTVKLTDAGYEVRWEKGAGVEIFFPMDDMRFESSNKDGSVNQFSFDNKSYDTGTFNRDDGKSFAVKRSK